MKIKINTNLQEKGSEILAAAHTPIEDLPREMSCHGYRQIAVYVVGGGRDTDVVVSEMDAVVVVARDDCVLGFGRSA